MTGAPGTETRAVILQTGTVTGPTSMSVTMALNKNTSIVLGTILLIFTIWYCLYLIYKIDDSVQELTQDQKEMMELLETWKKCV